jgi:hypothetical protein
MSLKNQGDEFDVGITPASQSYELALADLATHVPELMILERCRCGDDICATFYTQPKPKGGFGPGHRNMRLMPEEGMLILDIVAGEISCIEVLDRADVRQKLFSALP